MAEKKVNFELIDDFESEPYRILERARLDHGDISGAKIALAWRKEIKPDKDGHLVLGKCVKVTDLYREFLAYDFVIILNREIWGDDEFDEKKKLALMDHELSHAAPASDDDGEQYDERGRQVWRLRAHDLEEFYGTVDRHGCYKRDLIHFAELLAKKRRTPLFESELKKPSDPMTGGVN